MSTLTSQDTEPTYFTPLEASKYLRIKPKTLQNMRAGAKPYGPPWIKVTGRCVRYSKAALDAYMAKQSKAA